MTASRTLTTVRWALLALFVASVPRPHVRPSGEIAEQSRMGSALISVAQPAAAAAVLVILLAVTFGGRIRVIAPPLGGLLVTLNVLVIVRAGEVLGLVPMVGRVLLAIAVPMALFAVMKAMGPELRRRVLLDALYYGGQVVGVLLLTELALYPSIVYHYTEQGGRFGGFAGNPNHAGIAIACFASGAIYRSFFGKGRKLVPVLTLAMLTFLLSATGSRGALLGFGLQFLVAAGARASRRAVFIRSMLIVCGLMLSTLMMEQGVLFQRLTEMQDTRSHRVAALTDTIMASPWIGQTPDRFSIFESSPLTAMLYLGVFVGIPLSILYVGLANDVIRGVLGGSAIERSVAGLLGALLVVSLFEGTFFGTLTTSTIALYLTICGVSWKR